MKFKVSFYTKYNTSMQTETVEASSKQEAFQMFAVTGCFDIEVTEIELPARNVSQSSDYIRNSVRYEKHAVDEASELDCPHIHYYSAMFNKLECADCKTIFNPRTPLEGVAALNYNGRGSRHWTKIEENDAI